MTGLALPSTTTGSRWPAVAGILPGLLLCAAITVAAVLLQRLEARLFGRAWLEAVVLSILLGAAVRTVWTPGRAWRAGIEFSAKLLLEIAVVLLGASLSLAAILAAGPALLALIPALVALSALVSYGLGRLLGLSRRMAVLIACGNSICGNSAIAAVAPVIHADGKEVAASIAFTAILGVLVVIGLPLLGAGLHLSASGFGVFAGLTVYAVPQVLAATLPVGPVAAQIGALVKLVRVLMLGPMCLLISVLFRGTRGPAQVPGGEVVAGEQPERGLRPDTRFVPWFILGFLALAAVRNMGLVPALALKPIAESGAWLTVVSMAALGLGVDVKVLAGVGPRVASAVTLSIILLGMMALGLMRVAGLW